jgi:two-component system sensor histidine kinase MprB
VAEGSITVTDAGPGVPEDELGRIFDRFYRPETSKSLPGSGLGLSIVAGVAEAHGGTTFARNRPSRGLEIGMTFPTS